MTSHIHRYKEPSAIILRDLIKNFFYIPPQIPFNYVFLYFLKRMKPNSSLENILRDFYSDTLSEKGIIEILEISNTDVLKSLKIFIKDDIFFPYSHLETAFSPKIQRLFSKNVFADRLESLI